MTRFSHTCRSECNGHACTPGQQVCLNPFHYQLLDPQKIIDLLCKHQLLYTTLQVNTRRVAVAQFCQQLHAVLRSGHVAHNAAAFSSIPSLSRTRPAVPAPHPRLPSHPTTAMAATPGTNPHRQAVPSCSSAPNVTWFRYSSTGEGMPMAPVTSSWLSSAPVCAIAAHFGPAQYFCGPVPSHHQLQPPPLYPLQPHWQYQDHTWQHSLEPSEQRSHMPTVWSAASDAGDSGLAEAPALVPEPVSVGAPPPPMASASVAPVRGLSVSDSELELMIVEDEVEDGADGADEGGESDGEELDFDGDCDSESSDVSGARPNGEDEDHTSMAYDDSAPSCGTAQPHDARGPQRYGQQRCSPAPPKAASQPSLSPRASWTGTAYRGYGHCSSAASQSSRSRGNSPAHPARHYSRSRSPSCYPQTAAAVATGACHAAGQPCAPPSAVCPSQAWPSTASQGSVAWGACPPLIGPTAAYPDTTMTVGSTSSTSCPSPQVGYVPAGSDNFVSLFMLATAASRASTNQS